MSAHPHLAHLKHFAEDMIKSLGKRSARGYLHRCIDHWREHYGDLVAKQMTMHIKALFEASGSSRGK